MAIAMIILTCISILVSVIKIIQARRARKEAEGWKLKYESLKCNIKS